MYSILISCYHISLVQFPFAELLASKSLKEILYLVLLTGNFLNAVSTVLTSEFTFDIEVNGIFYVFIGTNFDIEGHCYFCLPRHVERTWVMFILTCLILKI